MKIKNPNYSQAEGRHDVLKQQAVNPGLLLEIQYQRYRRNGEVLRGLPIALYDGARTHPS
jgi:hypothetical protein